MSSSSPKGHDDKLIVGQVGRPHGVRGWMRIISSTEPPEHIFTYTPWHIKSTEKDSAWQHYTVTHHKVAGNHFIAKLKDCDDRDSAQALTHAAIAIAREQLAPLDKGEYYWSELEGLTVLTTNGDTIGQVDHLFETGSNDVLVVKDVDGMQHFIPYTDDAVKKVDLENRTLTVDEDFIFRS